MLGNPDHNITTGENEVLVLTPVPMRYSVKVWPPDHIVAQRDLLIRAACSSAEMDPRAPQCDDVRP
jgi:hypothetical protein